MKRFNSRAILAFFLLAVVLAAGCSSAEPAGQSADPNADTQADPLTSETAGDTDELSPQPESDWTIVFDSKISHPTNMGGFLNGEFGITVGYDGEVHYTNDGGQTWPEGENSSMCLFCLDIVDENIVWAGGNGSNVRVSNDGGKTWSAVSDINIGRLHNNIDFVDDTTGWITSLSRFAATNDGGNTWTELPLPEGASSIAAICLRTPQDGYLLSHDGLFFITADGGATWSQQDLGLANYDIVNVQKQSKLVKNDLAVADISFTDENNGTIVFTGLSSSGEGYKTLCLTTTDGGATWESEVMPEAEFAPTKVFISGDGIYLTLSNFSNRTVILQREG
jgi:Uncharacterized protein related to plant photosystem II stability/assembly factor